MSGDAGELEVDPDGSGPLPSFRFRIKSYAHLFGLVALVSFVAGWYARGAVA